MSQQGNDKTDSRQDQKRHKDVDEVSHHPSSFVYEPQNEDAHGDLDEASTDDEFNAFHEGPLDESGQLRGCQSFDMPAGAICNLIDVDHGAQQRKRLSW